MVKAFVASTYDHASITISDAARRKGILRATLHLPVAYIERQHNCVDYTTDRRKRVGEFW